MKRQVLCITVLSLMLSVGHASWANTFINFDTGTAGNALGAFYAAEGVTFANAQWTPNFVGSIYLNAQATAPFGIDSISAGEFNSVADPIVVTFATPQTTVDILAVNVGFAGARMDAYDAVVGGTLVDFAEAFGTTLKGEIPLGGGFFTDEEFLLQVQAASIRRLELYRPVPVANDGILFDNLTFTAVTAVPEPSTLSLLAMGIVVGGCRYVSRRLQRNKGKSGRWRCRTNTL